MRRRWFLRSGLLLGAVAGLAASGCGWGNSVAWQAGDSSQMAEDSDKAAEREQKELERKDRERKAKHGREM